MPATRLTVPPTGACTLVMVRVSPSTSVSLPSKVAGLMTRGVSSLIGVSVSVTATGASLTGAMASVKVEVSVAVGEPLPSLTV